MKIAILCLCVLFVSCFTEPKKETENTQSVGNFESINSNVEKIASEKLNDSINLKTFKEETLITETNSSDIILELNSINDRNGNKIVMSFIDEKEKLMMFFGKEFKIQDVYLVYVKEDFDRGFGVNYIYLECKKNSSSSNCLYDIKNSDYVSSIAFPLSTEEECVRFIELFNKLR